VAQISARGSRHPRRRTFLVLVGDVELGPVIRATHARHIYEVVDLAVASVDMQSGRHMRGLLLHNFTSL